MASVKRTLTASGAWLSGKATSIAQSLNQRSGEAATTRQFIDGYLLIAKKIQGFSSKSGPSLSARGPLDNNSILSVAVLDLPALLCLPGKYILPTGTYDPDKAYVQALSAGRDSYLPGSITGQLSPQAEPLMQAGPYTDIALGSRTITTNRVPTRFWGVAQPFPGVGCMYGYGAVYESKPTSRWALSWAGLTDTFVYRLVVLAPSELQYMTTAGVERRQPDHPAGLATAWTLEISDSVLNALGAVAFTRFEGDDPKIGRAHV